MYVLVYEKKIISAICNWFTEIFRNNYINVNSSIVMIVRYLQMLLENHQVQYNIIIDFTKIYRYYENHKLQFEFI